jgi:hypothetical protein
VAPVVDLDAALVELVRRYCNRADLLQTLQEHCQEPANKASGSKSPSMSNGVVSPVRHESA